MSVRASNGHENHETGKISPFSCWGRTMVTAIDNQSRKMEESKSNLRSPLSAVNTAISRQRSLRMDNASDVSDLQQVSLFDFGESEFELMHVRVTVHALTGLLSETERPKASKKIIKSTLSPKGKKNGDVLKNGEPTRTSDESTLNSSLSSSSAKNGSSYIKPDKAPTFAIASFGRNVTNSQTSIKTHIPSLPLGIPTSSFGYINRYMAQWQEPKPIFLQEEGEVDNQSSFTFLRVMMKEPLGNSGELYGGGANTTASKYVHETLNIEINLSRGSEIIPLGVATLAISGDEEGPQQMNLPAKAIVFKGNKKVIGSSADVKKSKKMFKKKLKRAYFPADPKRKYFLDENATLRVSVLLTPQDAINDAHAKQQARELIRKQLEEMKAKRSSEDFQDENEGYTLEDTLGAPKTKPTSDSKTEILHMSPQAATKPTFFGGLFCNAGACTNTTTEQKSQRDALCDLRQGDDYSLDSSAFDQMVQEKYGYSLASSVLSSVSESDSESDESSVDPNVHINRKIVVKKRRGKTPKAAEKHG